MKTLVAGTKQGEAGEKCSESEMIEGKAQEGKPAVDTVAVAVAELAGMVMDGNGFKVKVTEAKCARTTEARLWMEGQSKEMEFFEG